MSYRASSYPTRDAAGKADDRVGPDEKLERVLVQAAVGLARQLLAQKIERNNGTVTWEGPTTAFDGAVLPRAEAGPHLYDGTAGIALFLSAVERVTGTGEFAAAAVDALAPLQAEMYRLLERRHNTGLGVGGLIGISSWLYAILRVGQFLGDAAWMRDAHELSALLGPELIAQDRSLDVTFGSAGALLVALALDAVAAGRNSRGMTPLDIAHACGEQLLRQRVSYRGGFRAWCSVPGSSPRSGFAHGASGICWALYRLYERDGDLNIREAVTEGLEFERSLYSPVRRNWRDQPEPDAAFHSTWCYGAPGIALARVGMADAAHDPLLAGEVATALSATRDRGLGPLDHVCCGNLGRCEIMLQAGLCLGDPALLAAAYDSVRLVLRMAKTRGGFEWWPGGVAGFNPFLFKGAAGAGYTFLRFLHPAALPSFLLLE